MRTFFRLLSSALLPGPAGGRWSRRALLAARTDRPAPDPVTEAKLIMHRAVVERLPIADGLAQIRERITTQPQRRWWWPW
ncbi:hypothetical protein [Streptosporangium sp. CA-115845]|uniref:hypothetical protein n=1 Tax=Streptosporangium sp. CA-115845 TaxID=3240071 RepID=UPI003D94A985